MARRLILGARNVRLTDGAPDEAIELPSSVGDEFIVTWLRHTDCDDPAYPGRTLPFLTDTALTLFRESCEASRGVAQAAYVINARYWPQLFNGEQTWRIQDHVVVFHHEVGLGDIHRFVLSSEDHRFIHLKTGGYVSLPQFELSHGRLYDYLKRYLDIFSSRAKVMLDVLQSPLRTVSVTVATVNGDIAVVDARGPAVVPPSQWVLPSGNTYLSAAGDE